MGASSVTGVSGAGVTGVSSLSTMTELSRWSLGPQILIAGIASTGNSSNPPFSPPLSGEIGEVIFPVPFPGLGEEHCVILTTLNGGFAYVIDMDDRDLDDDDTDDHFTGFTFIAESTCDVMYIVTKVGQRPS